MAKQQELAAPHNPDAERTILGCVILDNTTFQEAVAENLRAEDFFLESHRRIYMAMAQLNTDGFPIDMLTLAVELDKHPSGVDGVGGIPYISNLIDGVPHQPSIKQYVDMVRDLGRRRRFIATMRAGIAAGFDTSETTRDCVAITSDKLLSIQGDDDRRLAQKLGDFSDTVIEEMRVQATTKREILGLSFGIKQLDAATTGIREGEIIVVGGFTSAGKTSVAVQTLCVNAAQSIPCVMFSIEMKRESMWKRICSRMTDIHAFKFRNPKMFHQDDYDALFQNKKYMDALPIYIDDEELDLTELLARARLYINRFKAKLIVVDYIQILSVKSELKKTDKISRAALELRKLGKVTNIPIMVLSQVSRPDSKDPNTKPNKFMLKESGDVENSAHMILMPWRPVNENGEPTGEDEILIEKQREGITGPIKVKYDTRTLTYRDRDWEREPEGQMDLPK